LTAQADSDHDSDQKARIDRELIEMLNELRVMLPGVQVLFAFLLTVPFAAGFSRANDLHQALLLTALLTAALAVGFLVAPAAQHRVLFRAREKERLLRRSNRFAIVGTAFLAVSVTASVLLVVDYLFRWWWAATAAGIVAAVLLWTWLIQPLRIRVGLGRAGELTD